MDNMTVHEYGGFTNAINISVSLSVLATENTSDITERNNTNKSGHFTSRTTPDSYNFMTNVERYAVPMICLFGLVGNTISFIVFLRKTLRSNSCNLFLAARSISDNGFIIILFIIWLSSTFDLKLSHRTGICQIIITLSYVFGCISVWLVVFVTVENYIRVCRPFMVNEICKTTNAKIAVGVLIGFVLCCYHYPLWTTTKRCVPYPKYYNLIQKMVYVDTVLTLVLPTLIMSLLMAAMARSSVSACQRRRRLQFNKIKNTKNPMTKVTTMLLAVTLIFFTLNMPSHVIRLRLMIISISRNSPYVTTSTDLIFQSLSQLLYYTSLAINIIVYFLFGSNFRKTFFGLFSGRISHVSVQTDNSVLSGYNRSKTSHCHSVVYSFTASSNESSHFIKDDDQEMEQASNVDSNETDSNRTEIEDNKHEHKVVKNGIAHDIRVLIEDDEFIYPLRRFRSSNL
ncbi:7 transmembrane receptor (rhodopsin) [Mactra antiquata]